MTPVIQFDLADHGADHDHGHDYSHDHHGVEHEVAPPENSDSVGLIDEKVGVFLSSSPLLRCQ